MTRIVTLGDSITLGIGDPRARRQLARLGLPARGRAGQARSCTTSRPNGAQAKHVERDQLPTALLLRPHVASVVVGINDTLRAGFDPVRTGQATARTVAALTAGGATVITMRLPDPAQMFGLPSALARPLSRRMRAVNAELDRIAAHYGTVHWDASTDPETYDRRNWSVDRLHPNERGHRLIACRLWDRLAAAGVPVAERPGSEPTSPAPTRRDDVLWMATKGTRWFLRRSVDLIPYMLFMAAREALAEPREWPARRCRRLARGAARGSAGRRARRGVGRVTVVRASAQAAGQDASSEESFFHYRPQTHISPGEMRLNACIVPVQHLRFDGDESRGGQPRSGTAVAAEPGVPAILGRVDGVDVRRSGLVGRGTAHRRPRAPRQSRTRWAT